MIIESIFFGIASGLGIGASDVGAAAVTRRVGVLRTAVSVQVAVVLIMTPLLLIESAVGTISWVQWLAMAGLGLGGIAFYLAFYRAVQIGPVAIITPILAANSMIVVIMGVLLLGDVLSNWQLASISTIIGGIILSSVDLSSLSNGQKMIGTGVIIALVLTVAVGMWQFGLGALSQELGWFLPAYLSRIMTVGGLLPFAAVRGALPWRGMSTRMAAGTFIVAMLEAASLCAFTRGAQIGVLSIVAAASAVYPMVPIMGGLVLFKERLAPSQIIGIIAVIVGLVGLGATS